MGFTTSCFIRKNTPELRKKLKEIGYKFSGADHIELDCIVTFPHHDTFSVFAAHRFNIYDDSFNTIWKGYIDCGTNEELFLALAALRNDSDYMQWFTDGKFWYQDKVNDIEVLKYGAGKPIDFHKATVEEIIEHFK